MITNIDRYLSMSMKALDSIFEAAKLKVVEIVTAKDLLDAEVAVSVTPLTAEEASRDRKRIRLPYDLQGSRRLVAARKDRAADGILPATTRRATIEHQPAPGGARTARC